MKTVFWRFAYLEDDLASIIASHSLPFPDLGKWPLAKNNSRAKVMERIRVGHIIFLANFDRTSELGVARVIGKVVAIDGTEVNMQWVKLVPSLSLRPDIGFGVTNWNTEGVFCFDAQPAKRYKLDAFATRLFSSVNTRTGSGSLPGPP